MEEEDLDAYRKLPIFEKANELLDLTPALVDTIDPEKDKLQMAEYMMASAMIIPAKIAGAEGGGLYSLRMENAIIIKRAAMDLLASTSSNRMEGINPPEHLQLLRDEIENFRLLYKDWIEGFDKSDDIDDGWYQFP